MISKIKNDLQNIRLENVPYEEREYYLEKKEFDCPKPSIEITFDSRIPSPFIRRNLNDQLQEN